MTQFNNADRTETQVPELSQQTSFSAIDLLRTASVNDFSSNKTSTAGSLPDFAITDSSSSAQSAVMQAAEARISGIASGGCVKPQQGPMDYTPKGDDARSNTLPLIDKTGMDLSGKGIDRSIFNTPNLPARDGLDLNSTKGADRADLFKTANLPGREILGNSDATGDKTKVAPYEAGEKTNDLAKRAAEQIIKDNNFSMLEQMVALTGNTKMVDEVNKALEKAGSPLRVKTSESEMIVCGPGEAQGRYKQVGISLVGQDGKVIQSSTPIDEFKNRSNSARRSSF